MTLSTLGGIKTAIDDFLSRQGDFTSAYKAEYFVPLAHARIHYGSDDPRFPSEPVRIRCMEASETMPTTTYALDLPAGYLAMRQITVFSDLPSVLKFVPPMDFWRAPVGAGIPNAYTIMGSNAYLRPGPDSEYTASMLYWRALDLPTADADSNWIMTNVPGAYLYGALLEAACVIQDDEQIARYGPMFAGAIGGLIKSDKRSAFSGAPLQMRNDTSTP